MAMLYSVAEVASILKVSEATVRAWIRLKKVPIIKCGGSVRFKEEDISKILESGLDFKERAK